tara:strand:- start:1147 stop:1431 length:285 start_codon:yes stop_codon:yes gene_type:complete
MPSIGRPLAPPQNFKDADAAFEELKKHQSVLDEAMIVGPRSELKAAKDKYDADVAPVRKRLNEAVQRGYKRDDMPRTFKQGGEVKRGWGKARSA